MWHKAIWKGHPVRLELTRVGLLVELANHYTTRGAYVYVFVHKYTNMEKERIRRMILFIVELFACVEWFGFYVKPLSGQIYHVLYFLNYI